MELQEQERAEDIIRETPPEERYSETESETTPSFGSAAPAAGAHVQIRDKADRQRRNRRIMGISMVWVITLGAIFLTGLLGFMFKDKIVDRYPQSASIYKAFGVDVKLQGLDLEDPTTRNVDIDGVNTLVINGHVRNYANEPRDVPMIELYLVNAAGDKLASWAVETDPTIIEPNGRLAYVSQYPNPPLDAAKLRYRFLDEGEVLPIINVASETDIDPEE